MTSWQLQGSQEPFQRCGRGRSHRRAPRSHSQGKPVVVVLAYEEYQRLRESKAEDTPSFVSHLMTIPKGTDEDGFELPERTKDYTSKAVEI